jgi:hypothetical protein
VETVVMAHAYSFIPIKDTGALPGRPFTSRDRALADLRYMNDVAGRLKPVLMVRDLIPPAPRPLHLALRSPEGRGERIILCDLERLLGPPGGDLFVVGFFGDRRPNADPALIEAVDSHMLAELGAFPEVLCYCSFELGDGNYGNLVILSDDAGREHWRTSLYHQYAAAEVAPGYYQSVRLHNGLMPGGLANGEIHLTRTKYFDYQDRLWCGVREFAG